jgi:hypothetical protein
MKTIQQLSLFIENKPGAISGPIQALADAGINLYSLSVADTKFFGVLRLLVRDPAAAAAVLEKAGFVAKTTEVVAIQAPNEPGSLAKILAVLDRHQVNVEYMYAFAASTDGKAALVFRFVDPEDAIRKIESELTIVGADYLFG